MDNIYGERFVSVKESAWHRLGTVIDEPIPASEALQLADVTYGVRTETLYLPGGVESGYMAVVRDATPDEPEERVFGVAKEYDLVHVTDVDLDSVEWPIATVGALRHGAEIFVTFDLGDREMLGENYKMYLSVVHPYAPGISWRVMLTPVRIVCQNTLIMGEEAARSTIAVSHKAGAKARIDTAMLLARAEAMESQALQRLEHLSKIRIGDARLETVLNRVYGARKPKNYVQDPTPEDSFAEQAAAAYQYRLDQEAKVKQTVKMVYDRFNDEHVDHAGSGYALYQAIVEFEDYHLGARTSETRAAEMALVGGRATNKKKALKTILALN